jgi:hypothetical protein
MKELNPKVDKMIDYLMMSYNYEIVEFEALKLEDIVENCSEEDKNKEIAFKIIGRIDNHIQKLVNSLNLNNTAQNLTRNMSFDNT